MFRIQAEAEKGNKHRTLPMAPEFAEMLAATPESRRDGFVFDPPPIRPGAGRPTLDRASRIICEIGAAAGVKVAEKTHARRKGKAGEPKPPAVKCASAHDLRRAFGFRWAMRVRTPNLQQLMRHESIHTTLTYYVGQDAEAAADALWAAVSPHSAAEAVPGSLPTAPADRHTLR